jgi:LPS-assembly protein
VTSSLLKPSHRRFGVLVNFLHEPNLFVRLVCLGAATGLVCAWSPSVSQAQAPSNQAIFSEDLPREKLEKQLAVKQAMKPKAIPSVAPGLDFQAPSIEFRKEKHEIEGKGGVLLSEGGVQVQADEVLYNTESKLGDVKGNVLMTTSAGVLGAESGLVNTQSETGDFNNLEFDVEEGGYRVEADQARKVSEFEFELYDSDMTSCRCPDGAKPWEIAASRCNITQEGYAHSYGSTFYFEGLPLLYSPYLVFPVKNERASGLMPAQIGVNSRDGFVYQQPIFLSIDDSTGFTVAPFIYAKSRIGSEFTFEKVLSETSRIDSGLIYSNESLRFDNGVPALRGLVTSGVADPSIDEQRFGGFYKQRWRSDKDDPTPIEFIADGHYTSDNMFLREIPEVNIGTQNAQFLSSTAVLRGTAFDFLNLEGRSEYNQMLLTPQELVFQRVPEFAASATDTLRPFGVNPLGLKVVTSGDMLATNFMREDGYDGWRTNIHPKVALPFHVSSFLRAEVSAEMHQTNYMLNETVVPPAATSYYPTAAPTPGTPPVDSSKSTTQVATTPAATPAPGDDLDDSISRTLPVFNYQMTSGVERVYDLDRGNWFSKVVGLGARNEGSELTRLKHTVEPLVSYRYVPDVDQSQNPTFDALDRFQHRSLVAYGFTSRLYGRFHEPYERTREVEELTAAGETIPMFDLSQSLIDFGRGAILSQARAVDTREGEIRELGQFYVRQGYDFVDPEKNNTVSGTTTSDTSDTQFTDVNTGLVMSPSYYFSLGFDSNISTVDSQFTSTSLLVGFRDDRDDALRARYTFNDGAVNQIEGNLEIKLTEQLKLGAYGRYDAREDKFQESQGLLRFSNACNCWAVDLGVGQRINPDRSQVLVNFTLGGVGTLRQGFGVSQQSGQ